MDASIWDEPVVQESPKRVDKSNLNNPIIIEEEDDAPQRPKKRPRQTLFYADSDDDIETVPDPSNTEIVLQAPPPHDIDIDALFAGIDDDDNDEISRPLPAILDEAELTRQAEERYKKNPLMTLHEILPSSSPARGEQDGRNGRLFKDNDDEKTVRKRQLRLDENLLLSPTGFPQLIKMTKNFTIKGKGHEAADLDRILRIYQYWTHQLYPKTTFTDTVQRVEKLCHSRRMNVALSVWRDEAHGKFVNHLDINGNSESGDEDEHPRQNMDPVVNSLGRSSSPITRSDPPNQTIRADTSSGDPEDDEEFWKTIDSGMEASLSDAPTVPPTSGPNSSMDEDDDMWGIIDEVEKGASETATAPPEITVAAGPLPENHQQDDDWDDMYV